MLFINIYKQGEQKSSLIRVNEAFAKWNKLRRAGPGPGPGPGPGQMPMRLVFKITNT